MIFRMFRTLSALAISLGIPVAVLTAAETPMPAPEASPSPSPGQEPGQQLLPRTLPEVHATVLLPRDWTLLPGKLLEGDVLLATREKIGSEEDAWTVGFSMTVDRIGAKESGQKAAAYALGLANEAREKAGEEASPITESQSGPFHEIRFEFPLPEEQPLLVTEVLRANEETGTVTTIVWRMPKQEADSLRGLRDTILSGVTLDPKL